MAFGRLKVDELVTSTQTVSVDALVGIAADGDKGDITVSSSGTVWTIDDGAVDTAALGGDITIAGKALLDDADAAAQRTTLGAEAAGTAASAISTHEAAADPHPGYALESSLATVATTGALGDLGDVDLTTTPPADGEALVYDSATGEWVPGAAGATAAGSANEIQYNDGAGGLAASADLTWDNTGKELGVGGDINLASGGTYTTTLQTITPTAARTISFPDATGTIALVAGSSGQLVYNNAGAYAGAPSTSVGASGDITLSLNGAASTPPLSLTGTWFTGGTSTTTKPHVLIEPAGTTSTAWSTSGTGFGVNAASGFTGNLLDLQVGGTSLFSANAGSAFTIRNSSGFKSAEIGNSGNYGYIKLGRPNVANASHIYADNNGLYITRVANFDDAISFSPEHTFTPNDYRIGNNFTIEANFHVHDAATSISTLVVRGADTASRALDGHNITVRGGHATASLLTDADGGNVLIDGGDPKGLGTKGSVTIGAIKLKLPNLPTYADNTAATSGGLVAGDVYKTATGELRITV